MYDPRALNKLTEKMLYIEAFLEEQERRYLPLIESLHPNYQNCGRNLIHYLALRTFNIHKIQDQLSALGLSSIAHSERYTLPNVKNILKFLVALRDDTPIKISTGEESISSYRNSRNKLRKHALELLGDSNRKHSTRIMVTMPTEAASDLSLLIKLLENGMDLARINCSHDHPELWESMIRNITQAELETGKRCQIYMDLAGPKIRTGPVEIIERKKKKKKKPINYIRLQKGDQLELYRNTLTGHGARLDDLGRVVVPARISISLPSIIEDTEEGHQIWFDDGTIGGVIREKHPEKLVIEIIHANLKGSRLRAEKGINLPNTVLKLPSLTEEDLKHLPFIAKHADLVGYSFVRHPQDIELLQTQMSKLNRKDIGIVLKIENKDAFDNLPHLLLKAMKWPSVGVMTARGDLAVELGWERIAEVQEEILWLCEAAHIPNIWATQVLESLAKKGTASRAEITDAAMAIRAECVMLNKGPHIVEAVQLLHNILGRMSQHQQKKKVGLRKLKVAKKFFATTKSPVSKE